MVKECDGGRETTDVSSLDLSVGYLPFGCPACLLGVPHFVLLVTLLGSLESLDNFG